MYRNIPKHQIMKHNFRRNQCFMDVDSFRDEIMIFAKYFDYLAGIGYLFEKNAIGKSFKEIQTNNFVAVGHRGKSRGITETDI